MLENMEEEQKHLEKALDPRDPEVLGEPELVSAAAGLQWNMSPAQYITSWNPALEGYQRVIGSQVGYYGAPDYSFPRRGQTFYVVMAVVVNSVDTNPVWYHPKMYFGSRTGLRLDISTTNPVRCWRVINGNYVDVSGAADVKCPRPPTGPDANGLYSLREREVPWRDILEIWLPVRADVAGGWQLHGFLDSLSYPGRQINPWRTVWVSMWASDLQGRYRGEGTARQAWGGVVHDDDTEKVLVEITPTGDVSMNFTIRQSLWGRFELDSEGYAKNIVDRGSANVDRIGPQTFSTTSINTATGQPVGLHTQWYMERFGTTLVLQTDGTHQSIVTGSGGWDIGARLEKF
jgi:hypothetical protein